MQETEKGESSVSAEPSGIDLFREEPRKDQERYLRLLDDFENYRRRIDRERANAAHSGKRGIILSLLDVLDDFERALQHIDAEQSSVSAGLHAIHRKLAGVPQAEGVTPFHSVGETFNPSVHEAVGSVESSEYPPGTVAGEARRGYRWGDEVLRPAGCRRAVTI